MILGSKVLLSPPAALKASSPISSSLQTLKSYFLLMILGSKVLLSLPAALKASSPISSSLQTLKSHDLPYSTSQTDCIIPTLRFEGSFEGGFQGGFQGGFRGGFGGQPLKVTL